MNSRSLQGPTRRGQNTSQRYNQNKTIPATFNFSLLTSIPTLMQLQSRVLTCICANYYVCIDPDSEKTKESSTNSPCQQPSQI